MLFGDFNAKEGKEDIFKLTVGNKCLHKISNDNCVEVVNFATSKNLTVQSTIDHILIDEGIQVCLTFDYSVQQIVILTTI
jgi:hypothetical protein